MRDELAKLLSEQALSWLSEGDEFLPVADAIIAALPDMVQPLEWGALSADEWGANGIAVRIAESSFGEYRIRSIPRASQHQLRTPFGECLEFDNYTDAKTAAQADYTNRILSAFGIAGET